MRLLPALALCLAAPALLAPRAARAQSSNALAGALWRPALSLEPDALPHVEGTRMPGRWNWNAGLALQFLERPYTVRDLGSEERRALVDYQLWSTFLVQLGLARHFALGLELPVLVQQHGDRTVYGSDTLGRVGVGDLRAVARWSTRGAAPAGRPGVPAPPDARSQPFANEGPGLAVLAAVSVPTGEGRSLSGAGAWQLHPSVVGDFRLFGLLVAAQLGYRFRFDEHWPAQQGVCLVPPGETAAGLSCLGGVPLRDGITWSAGVRMPSSLLGGLASVYFEAFGSVDARRPFSAHTTPVELSLGAQRVFGPFTATVAVGTGVTDVPGTPRVSAMLLLQWAPRFVDEDGDGLRDDTGEDQCVGLPEDRDGYQDDDGCPEDNDNDDIPDAEDRCPNEDEDVDGFEDDDGCPDPDNDQDGVLDTEDQCPNVAMGPDPDEARPGCPREPHAADEAPDAPPPASEPAPAP
jgi:hypothetical protein